MIDTTAKANITKLTFINFCTRFHLYIHVYALLLQSRDLTLLQISTIESAVIATMFLMEVPTGIIADRIPRRWSISAFVFLLMCGELLFLFGRSYPVYLVVAVFTGTGFAFASGAMESLIYDSLPKENRELEMKRAMGRYGSVGQIAFFLSPIVGGFIVGDLTPERFNVAIALTAAALFIGLLVSFTLREPATDWEARKTNPLAILRDGWAELYHSHSLRRLMLVTILTTPFTGVLITTFAAPHLNQNHVSPFMIALALSGGSLLSAITHRYAYRVEQWLGVRWGIAALTLLPGLSYLALAFAAGPGITWLVIVWMYATNDMRAPLISAYQNTLISTESRATTLSIINMFMSLFVAVMGPVYAALGTQSLPLAFLAMGVVILASGAALRVDRLMARPESEAVKVAGQA